jgi:anti-sigma regulatory factor (Ser/Thr protein kinase)
MPGLRGLPGRTDVITAVTDASQVAEARRRVADFARRSGIAEPLVEQVKLAVTELATNLLKHAGGGQIMATALDPPDDRHAGGGRQTGRGLEVLALDRGKGMADVDRCMADGYSTAGSPGTGLGAIARLADDLRIYSRPGLGTAILARFLPPTGRDAHAVLGAAVAPYPGEQVCGDAWRFSEAALGDTLLVADGAGHGPEAARAADIAAQVFQDHAGEPCEEIVGRMHRALMPTRGAAVAVARIDAAAQLVRYVGVGNICGVLVSADGTRHMVSHNGTAGHVAPRIREFTYNFTGRPMVIMHSDGLTSRWDLASYPGLSQQHPSLIAGVLLRDHRRARDDASVVVLRASL